MNKQNDSFKIPDNYFKDFEERLSKKISVESMSSKSKTISLINKKKIKYTYFIAASLLLFLGISYFFKTNQKDFDNNDELLAVFIDDAYIDEYLDNYLIDSLNED